MKVQINGVATVIGSKKLKQTVKDAALKAGEGKTKYLEVTLQDEEGNTFVFRAPLTSSKAGSLMGHYALKGEAVIVEADSRPDAEAQGAARAASLEAELLKA